MPIRSQDDSTSRVAVQEKEYFKKQDKTATSMNFNRFLFMPPKNFNIIYCPYYIVIYYYTIFDLKISFN